MQARFFRAQFVVDMGETQRFLMAWSVLQNLGETRAPVLELGTWARCWRSIRRADTDATDCVARRRANPAPASLDRHPPNAENAHASAAPNPGEIVQ